MFVFRKPNCFFRINPLSFTEIMLIVAEEIKGQFSNYTASLYTEYINNFYYSGILGNTTSALNKNRALCIILTRLNTAF